MYQKAFVERILPLIQADTRLVGLAVGGSWLAGTMDEFSDIDLVLVVKSEAYSEMMAQRMEFAASLGNLLSAFTGEHVGEPRLLICLYAEQLLHVDLKFVAIQDFSQRFEDPVILWERDSLLSQSLQTQAAQYPLPDLQALEDRFWIWLHYGATKLGRGELYEVIDMLGFVRGVVLGPMAALKNGKKPRGARNLEQLPEAPEFLGTHPSYNHESCAAALLATAKLYQDLRETLGAGIVRRNEAEQAVMAYLAEVSDRK